LTERAENRILQRTGGWWKPVEAFFQSLSLLSRRQNAPFALVEPFVTPRQGVRACWSLKRGTY